MAIKEQILAYIEQNSQSKVADICLALGVSRSYVSRILQELRQEGVVTLVGKTRQAVYVLTAKTREVQTARAAIRHIFLKLHGQGLSEDIVFERIKRETGIFEGVSNNIYKLVSFGFTEMLNNAIDHSQSDNITVEMTRTDTAITFVVRDFGVGIFRNFQEKKRLPNVLTAIQELLKGKMTTAPTHHSGLGVFYTSRAADVLIIDSGNKKLTINNLIADIFIHDRQPLVGTKIVFVIQMKSQKQLVDVFRSASAGVEGDYEVVKTQIKVKLFQFGGDLLSRSEAKRVVVNLENFLEVELDFIGVETVGQAFCDEIFRVWQNAHQSVHFSVVNANENVLFMIKGAGWRE